MNALNFINSSVKYIKSGMRNATPEIQNQRFKICESCEFFDSSSVRCNSCGCFLEIKTKWSTEKCPLDKWGTEVATSQNQEILQPQTQNSSEKSGGCGCGK